MVAKLRWHLKLRPSRARVRRLRYVTQLEPLCSKLGTTIAGLSSVMVISGQGDTSSGVIGDRGNAGVLVVARLMLVVAWCTIKSWGRLCGWVYAATGPIT